MYVIRLPNGNLLVPESATARGGLVISDAYVEIGPADADYERLAEGALTEQEIDERRQRWRDGDDRLRRQFLDYLAAGGESAGGQSGGEQSGGEQSGGEQSGGGQSGGHA